ncbi:MAG: hypothetical protein R2685_07860 [Candidatus Nitrosocosmicus sp.]|nr:hypothetical protein [Candidatus Nitrosocosmicus sp.]
MIDLSDFILQVSNATAPAIQNSGLAQQVTSSGGDTASNILGVSGFAAGIGAAIKSVFTDKTQKKNNREIDFDQEELRRLMKVEHDYTIKNPTKTRAEILAMPAYPDEPSIKTSLAEAYALDYKEYKKYNTKEYYQK